MNPYLITEPTCLSFSSGRSSGFMLNRILEENQGLPADAVVCFANTGKEREESLAFVKACQDNWKIPIVWLEFITEEPRFKIVNFDEAHRKGEPFKSLIYEKGYLPNPVTRFCTIELKIRTISKYCQSIGMDIGENDAWVGFRADEESRVAKIGRQRCPLAIDGVTVRDVGNFWKNNYFDLELPNLNGKTLHGNCDLCFLKGLQQKVSLIIEKPEIANWWIEMEKFAESSPLATNDGDKFRKDQPTYKKMLKYTKDQANLFPDETIGCFCGD